MLQILSSWFVVAGLIFSYVLLVIFISGIALKSDEEGRLCVISKSFVISALYKTNSLDVYGEVPGNI